MSLKEDMMSQLQDVWKKKFEDAMYQDTGNDLMENSFNEQTEED